MTRYVYNVPVLTAYGLFSFSKITVEEAVTFLRTPGWVSAISHSGTAQLLTQLSGVQVSLNRISTHMEPGDEALVFRLVQRQREGFELTLEAVRALPHEYGLLKRVQ